MSLREIKLWATDYTVEMMRRDKGLEVATPELKERARKDVDERLLSITAEDAAQGVVFNKGCGRPDCKGCEGHGPMTIEMVKAELVGRGYEASAFEGHTNRELIETMLINRPQIAHLYLKTERIWKLEDDMIAAKKAGRLTQEIAAKVEVLLSRFKVGEDVKQKCRNTIAEMADANVSIVHILGGLEEFLVGVEVQERLKTVVEFGSRN